MSKIVYSADERAHRITLAAPPLHILDVEMLEELRDALRNVTGDRHLLILDAEGEKAFSAGVSVQDHIGSRVVTMLAVFHECLRLMSRLEVVSVALVRAPALGGGCELAMACDFVLATPAARFGQPEIDLGVFAPVASYQLSRQLPPRRGLELLLTGESIDAREAEELGLVNAVVSNFEPWLARLYEKSASSLRLAKKAFRLAQADELEEKLTRVEQLYLRELTATIDANEGLQAFLEKRQPVWSHE